MGHYDESLAVCWIMVVICGGCRPKYRERKLKKQRNIGLISYPVLRSPTWRRCMMTFDSHLKEKLKNKRFKRMYEEEKELLDISLKILEARREQNLSQAELAKRAHITQQQLSRRFERGHRRGTQRRRVGSFGMEDGSGPIPEQGLALVCNERRFGLIRRLPGPRGRKSRRSG